jgi:hypothetical protein
MWTTKEKEADVIWDILKNGPKEKLWCPYFPIGSIGIGPAYPYKSGSFLTLYTPNGKKICDCPYRLGCYIQDVQHWISRISHKIGRYR